MAGRAVDGTPQAGAAAPVQATARTAGDTPPVDHERVNMIRKAIADGKYPLVPTEIADALIAAELFGITDHD